MLKPSGEPIMTRDKMTEMAVIVVMDHTGTDVRRSTLERMRQPGSPRSRANDHIMRDAEAKNPTLAHMARTVMMHDMTVAPATEFVAWRNISMKGNPVGESSAF